MESIDDYKLERAKDRKRRHKRIALMIGIVMDAVTEAVRPPQGEDRPALDLLTLTLQGVMPDFDPDTDKILEGLPLIANMVRDCASASIPPPTAARDALTAFILAFDDSENGFAKDGTDNRA